MTSEYIALLQHTLGAGPHKRKSQYGYRNRFCACVGSQDDITFQEMVAAGLAEVGPTINDGGSRYYRATIDGCKLAGLHKAAIKRAME